MAIQIRRGTDAEWESNKSNIVAGEPAVAMDSERMFIGTGSGTYMEVANIDVLADAFDSSASYDVGDFVSYHGKVYKFTSTHSGAWNASDVEEVALADALDALGDDVYTKAETDSMLALKADASDVLSALALKADKSDTYTKTEVNTALDLKADKSDTYTKTQVDTALNLKSDKDDTYTKAQVDSALALKANTNDVNSALALKADKSDTYTKSEVNTSLALKADKSDTYTKAQVDSALDLKANAGDVYRKTEIDTELEDYAKVDGYYESMTVGYAEQLISSVKENDKVPYFFRTSGGNAEIGNMENDTIVGGSVAWNQLVKNGNFADGGNNWGVSGTDASISVSNGILTLSQGGTGTSKNPYLYTSSQIPFIEGHKYFWSINFGTNVAITKARFFIRSNNSNLNEWVISNLAVGNYGLKRIINAGGTGLAEFRLYPDYNAVSAGSAYTFSNCMLIDLTQMFGTTIADYIYNLEQATAGAGVATLKSWGFFSKDYYAYNAGSIESVSGLVSHDMTGFNQFDKSQTLTVGYITPDGGNSGSSDYRYTDYIKVAPNTVYYFNGLGGTNPSIAWYDCDKNFIVAVKNNNTVAKTLTSPPNAMFVRISIPVGNVDTFIFNLHWDGERDGEYEPYIKHSYPLDTDLVLRGIPKVDADGNLYFDGDIYEHDGTVTRKYGIVDLGTLSWGVYSGGSNTFYAAIAGKKYSVATLNNFVQAKYSYSEAALAEMADKSMRGRTDNANVYIKDSAYTDAATFKAAMSGVYLVYELAEPTTESADPFADPQIVDNWGTEEYVSTGLVPVGHDTDYPIDIKAKVEATANNPSSDGIYILSYQNGTATYAPLASTDTITNIIARLEALEGGE